jgi:hypothetical protein
MRTTYRGFEIVVNQGSRAFVIYAPDGCYCGTRYSETVAHMFVDEWIDG